MKILIVDDSYIDLYLSKETIKNLGIDAIILEASDGEEALEIIKHEHPDIVLLDIKMPKMNGIDVLREIKRNYNDNNIKVIMVTTSDLDEDIKMAYNEKANGYIIKPITPQVFVDRMATIKNIFIDNNLEFVNYINPLP